MGWVAADGNGKELVYYVKPIRVELGRFWAFSDDAERIFRQAIPIPIGSIKKLIGRELTWDDEPVELKDE